LPVFDVPSPHSDSARWSVTAKPEVSPTLSQTSVSCTLSIVAPAGIADATSNSTTARRSATWPDWLRASFTFPVNIVGPAPSLRSAKASGAIGS
jgi:hypothetical protein